MKWLLRILIFFVILFTVTVVLPIALLWKSVTPPEFDLNSDFEFETLISDQLDLLIDDSNPDKEIGLVIDEEVINNEVYKILAKELSDNLTSEEGYIASFEDIVLLQGAWVTFKDNVIGLNVGIHAKYSSIKFKTRLLIEIKIVEASPEKISLQIKKINVGNMPLRWVVRYAPALAKSVAGLDVEELINNTFGNFGTYDKKKVTVTVDVKKLLSSSADDNPMYEDLLTLINEKELIVIKTDVVNEKSVLKVVLDLRTLENKKVPLILDQNERLNDEDDYKDFMESKVIMSLVSNKLTLNSKELSQIMDYMMNGGKSTPVDNLMSSKVYKDYELTVLLPYFEITNKATLNIPIQIGKNGNFFKSNVSIDVSFNKVGEDLVLNLSNPIIGTIAVDDEMLVNLLSSFDSDSMPIDGMSFTIEDFFADFSDEGLVVDEIVISNGKIEFIFEDNEISDFLNEIVNNFSNEDFKDIANDILDKINNNEDFSDDLDDLINEFENLSEAEKNELIDLINNMP